MKIELIKETEIKQTCKMIKDSVLHSSFAVFYPKCSTDYVIETSSEKDIREKAKMMNFYVAKENSRVIGCGAISRSGDICGLHTIFVSPAHQGKGIGRKIVEALESDDLTKSAKRIEIYAAMSAIPFYRKLGYNHKNDDLIYDDGQFVLEKILR